MIGTILSVTSFASDAANLFKFGTTLAKGDDTKRVLAALDRLHAEVERLNDHILYAPGISGLEDTSNPTNQLGNLRNARELLEPVQKALGADIVSSGLIETPRKLERAMIENPWAVLEDIRPQHLAELPSNPDKVPVLFEHNGVQFIGWQMRGALPQLFNCELHDLPGLSASTAQDFQTVAAGSHSAQLRTRTTNLSMSSPIDYENPSQLLIRTFGHRRWWELWKPGHHSRITSVAFSPDGRMILSGGEGGGPVLWKTATGQLIHSFYDANAHGDRSSDLVCFTKDGTKAHSCNTEKIFTWKLDTGALLRIIDIKSQIFTKSPCNNLKEISYKKLKEASNYRNDFSVLPRSPAEALEWSHDEDVNFDQNKNNISHLERSGNFRPLDFSEDGNMILLLHNNYGIFFCYYIDQKIRIEIDKQVTPLHEILDVSFLKDNDSILISKNSVWNNIPSILFRLSTGEICRKDHLDDKEMIGVNVGITSLIGTNTSGINSYVFSNNGRLLIVGGQDGVITLLDIESEEEIRTLEGHSGPVNSLAMAPDGRQVLSGSDDGTLKLWDIADF